MLKNHRPITARLTFALATFMLAAALVACSSPRPPISQSLPNLSLGVSGFTQPRTVNELLAGVAYSEQEHLSDNVLLELDMALQDTLLTESEHSFKPLSDAYACQNSVTGRGEKLSALDYWLAVGKCLDVDVLLVPQIIYWQERDGGEMGAQRPASVTLDMYMLNINQDRLISRYHFEETQESLSSNLLELGKFVERSGKWLSARDLAAEGMRRGVKELGL